MTVIITFFEHDKYLKPEAYGIVLQQYNVKILITNNINLSNNIKNIYNFS